MATFKVIGMAEEGTCEHCGANCPRRRVLVVMTDADGNACGDAQSWGVICASKVRSGGTTSARSQSRIISEAESADFSRERMIEAKMSRITDNASMANYRFMRTRREIIGSYFATDAAGMIVRVDATDAEDVEFFASRGFVQSSDSVES